MLFVSALDAPHASRLHRRPSGALRTPASSHACYVALMALGDLVGRELGMRGEVCWPSPPRGGRALVLPIEPRMRASRPFGLRSLTRERFGFIPISAQQTPLRTVRRGAEVVAKRQLGGPHVEDLPPTHENSTGHHPAVVKSEAR